MLVEIFARASILIEDKQVWIVIADMEMVVHARGFCTRRLDEAHGQKIGHLYWLIVVGSATYVSGCGTLDPTAVAAAWIGLFSSLGAHEIARGPATELLRCYFPDD